MDDIYVSQLWRHKTRFRYRVEIISIVDGLITVTNDSGNKESHTEAEFRANYKR